VALRVARHPAWLALCLGWASASIAAGATPVLRISDQADAGFVLAREGAAASILYDARDAQVVHIAAADLASDILAVSGGHAVVDAARRPSKAPQIIIGTLGHSALIDTVVKQERIDVSALRGAWESYLILSLPASARLPGGALVVVGSDRRGTAYGVFEVSSAIGVSPFHWWSDVKPPHRPTLAVPTGQRRLGQPAVRYRGIFINDEDWGLVPWAAKTFDPTYGNLGPKTYERVFDLMLRLRLNMLWPAMHKVSQPFNADPANARLADRYATNPTGVRDYWRKRVSANAQFESAWTLGMRGIHDSGMVGGDTTEQKVALLQTIISDQRRMLRDLVNPDLTKVQQVFMPYKEVLDLYRHGLKVPDDVTILWPEDNFGYIRGFGSPAERQRSGGLGVYYHLSYLGAPLSYLWLSTTPPALMQEELVRAWDLGARRMWVANVGDIKPAEVDLSYFADLAWDVERWRSVDQKAYLADWAGRTFGQRDPQAIGDVLDRYYTLNFERRPEHLQDSLPKGNPPPAPWSIAEANERLRHFAILSADSHELASRMDSEAMDGFFELIDYPVQASAAANRRYLALQRYKDLIDTQPALARSAGGAALLADRQIKSLTDRYEAVVAGGKWRHIMAVEPADNQWAGFRVQPLSLPAEGLTDDPATFEAAVEQRQPGAGTRIEVEDAGTGPDWRFIQGLGQGRGSLAARHPGATMTVAFSAPAQGASQLEIGLLPTYPDEGDGQNIAIAVAIDHGAPRRIDIPRHTGDPAWSKAVVDNLIRVPVAPLPAGGKHTLYVTAISSGVVLDTIYVTTGD